MAKLTKAQKREIETALISLNRLIAFIENPAIEICRSKSVNIETDHGPMDFRANAPHETKHFNGRDGVEWDITYIKELTPIDKGIGSDLVARYDVRQALVRLLEG